MNLALICAAIGICVAAVSFLLAEMALEYLDARRNNPTWRDVR